MKPFFCGDVVPGCTVGFKTANEEEILAAAAVHARRERGMSEIPDAAAEQMRALIRDTSAA